jgi:hypothetical protein
MTAPAGAAATAFVAVPGIAGTAHAPLRRYRRPHSDRIRHWWWAQTAERRDSASARASCSSSRCPPGQHRRHLPRRRAAHRRQWCALRACQRLRCSPRAHQHPPRRRGRRRIVRGRRGRVVRGGAGGAGSAASPMIGLAPRGRPYAPVDAAPDHPPAWAPRVPRPRRWPAPPQRGVAAGRPHVRPQLPDHARRLAGLAAVTSEQPFELPLQGPRPRSLRWHAWRVAVGPHGGARAGSAACARRQLYIWWPKWGGYLVLWHTLT